MNLSTPVLPALVSCLALPSVHAQEQLNEQDPIVVTATRTAQTADAALAPVEVITREDIESQPGADVSELLRLRTSVEIGRNGPPGQQTSVFIRGANSAHTLVMLDGVRLNPSIGNAAIQNIDPSTIERIEVVRGPRSTLYGSDAIGGVINIITRGPAAEEGARYEAALNGGSHGTIGGNFSAHNRFDPERAAGINLAYEETDGIPIRPGNDEDRGFDLASLHAYGSQRIGDTDVRVSHWQSEGTTEYLEERRDESVFPSPLLGFDAVDQDFTNRVTQASFDAAITDTWASRVEVSRTVDEIDQNQSADFTHTTRDAIDWQNDVQWGERQLLTLGAYLAREDVEADFSGTGFDEKTDIRAAYVQDDLQWNRHRLLLGARYTDHEGFGGHTTWNLEYGMDATERLRLIAAANTGFRAPSAIDRFFPGFGNPDLDPETSRNLELGLRYRPTATQRVWANAFDNHIDDLISFGATGMENVDEARIQGLETGWAYSGKNLRLEASATWQDPEDRNTGEQLARRAKENARIAADLDLGEWRLGADLLYSGERPDTYWDEAGVMQNVTLGDYTLVNLRASIELAQGLTLAARIENATDEDYELVADYNTLGRSYYAELRYAFGN